MSRRLFLIIAGLAVGLIVVSLAQRNRPERVIERQIERIEELVGKNGSENNLTTVGKMKNLMEMFHDPFEFRADPFDFSTRDPRSLAGAVQRYREGSERVTMRTSDREIEVDAASGRATSLVKATFSGGLSDFERDAYRFRIDWVETDGEWKIDYVEMVEVLAR